MQQCPSKNAIATFVRMWTLRETSNRSTHMSLTELPQCLGGTVPGRVAVHQWHHEIAEQRRHIINGLARHVQHLSLRALQRAVQMRKLCGM